MYRNDFGEYPPSHGYDGTNSPTYADYDYCGAQTLAEAMFGCDLRGFHPQSEFDAADNYPITSSSSLYYDDAAGDSLKARKGLYVDRTNLGVFDANDIFGSSAVGTIVNGYMICDIFDNTGRTKTIAVGSSTKRLKIGTPILYFRADTSKLDIESPGTPSDNIYDYDDNGELIGLDSVKDSTPHEIASITDFRDYITDEMASTTRIRPFRPDSFLLISAGPDGFYGTSDDICNFEPNF
jgi:hypothetical protein